MLYVIDDGVCALSFDSTSGGVVLKDHVSPGEGRAGYECRGVICRVGPGVCYLLGFDGYMSLRQMVLLRQLMTGLGYKTAYRSNHSNHRPWGELVERGFWRGEIHVDVERLPS